MERNFMPFLRGLHIAMRDKYYAERRKVVFSFLKKKKNKELTAMIDGVCIPMEEVKDETFSSKALGEGIAIVPQGNIIVAPCDGTLTLVADTKHAFGMTCEDGLELMVHIGIDTVALNGEGFKKHADAGVSVKKGQPIIEFDWDLMKEKFIDMSVMLILLNHQDYQIKSMHHGKTVKKGIDVVVEYC